MRMHAYFFLFIVLSNDQVGDLEGDICFYFLYVIDVKYSLILCACLQADNNIWYLKMFAQFIMF